MVVPSEGYPRTPVPAMSMTARWEVSDGAVPLHCAWGQTPDHAVRARWDLSVPERRTELEHLLEKRRSNEPVTVWLCKNLTEKLTAIGASMDGDEGLLLRSVLGWDLGLDCGRSAPHSSTASLRGRRDKV